MCHDNAHIIGRSDIGLLIVMCVFVCGMSFVLMHMRNMIHWHGACISYAYIIVDDANSRSEERNVADSRS